MIPRWFWVTPEERLNTYRFGDALLDSRAVVILFCLFCCCMIGWRVSLFEGFKPHFHCKHRMFVDDGITRMGIKACMADAHTDREQYACIRTGFILGCMKEVWD